jgi:BirA family transcriptional regulator, biotin operon repressor / biotin---[acetyl-CoA-carboxylase] ligase
MNQAEHAYAAVEDQLRGTAFAHIRFVESTGSTNDDAAALLGDERASGLTIVASHQTRGAGRKGRAWIAQPGTALLMTTIFPESMPTENLWTAPFGVAICVRKALSNNGIDTDLQWPNDLLLDGKKLGGILCVSRVVGKRAHVAAGVGINLRRTEAAADEIDPPPAFCDDVVQVDASKLLRDILLAYQTSHVVLQLPQRVARVWERDAGIPGKRYRILKDGESTPIEVTALVLATGGGLFVAHDDGQREVISLADARALR